MITEDIHYFVFGGGGVRGITFAGVIDEWQQLTNYDFKTHLKGAAGTSIGALYAAGLVSGLSPKQMLAMASITNLIDLVAMDLTNLWTHWGFDTGTNLVQWIDRHLGDRKKTFQQLYDETQKTLCIAVSNLNESRCEYISHETYPNMPVAEGVAMSMALPPVFAPRTWQNKTYVDGGLMDNYPIQLFPAKHTIGFRVTWGLISSLNGFEKYFSRLTYCALSAAGRVKFNMLSDEYKEHSIVIDAGDVSTINWRLGKNVASNLIRIGRTEVRNFVLQHNLRSILKTDENAHVETSIPGIQTTTQGTQTNS